MTSETADEKIQNAVSIAGQAGQSPAETLYRVMTALGFDFGDPALVETDVMQFYADPENNPFIQARLEARLLLDIGHLERLANVVRKGNPNEGDLRASVAAVHAAINMNIQETDQFHRGLCRLALLALCFALNQRGVAAFNAALDAEISRLESKPN